MSVIQNRLFDENLLKTPFGASNTLALLNVEQYNDRENGLARLHNDLTKTICGTENLVRYIQVLQSVTSRLPPRQLSIEFNVFGETAELYQRAIGLRCLLKNYFQMDVNEIGDQKIVNECLKLIDELFVKSKDNKEFLLYNEYA